MESLWGGFLDQVIDRSVITELVVYTDQDRFWFVETLLEYAETQGWKSSLLILTEITDEEGMEIRQSFANLKENVLLAAFFFSSNPIIEELLSIFPLLTPFPLFDGISLAGHHELPNQYLMGHLTTDIYYAAELKELLLQQFSSKIDLNFGSTFLEANVLSTASYPFTADQSHIMFPSTEIMFELELTSLEGSITAVEVIGSVYEQDELLDPFGYNSEKLELLIENGQVTDFNGSALVTSRLVKLVSVPTTFDRVQISIGLGHNGRTTGFLEQDRLLRGFVTLSFQDTQRDLLLEFGIGRLDLDALTNQ
ncbi:MAG: hypothetical protein ACXAE3_09745 [Candidatus Kariarchaeaceae archaeon]|jgi:hypothetical protein